MPRMLMNDRNYYGRWIWIDENPEYGTNCYMRPDDYWTNRVTIGRHSFYNGDSKCFRVSGDSESRSYPSDHSGAISRGRKATRRMAKSRERRAVRKEIESELY